MKMVQEKKAGFSYCRVQVEELAWSDDGTRIESKSMPDAIYHVFTEDANTIASRIREKLAEIERKTLPEQSSSVLKPAIEAPTSFASWFASLFRRRQR